MARLSWKSKSFTISSLLSKYRDCGIFFSDAWRGNSYPDLGFVKWNSVIQSSPTTRKVFSDFSHIQHRPVVLEVGISFQLRRIQLPQETKQWFTIGFGIIPFTIHLILYGLVQYYCRKIWISWLWGIGNGYLSVLPLVEELLERCVCFFHPNNEMVNTASKRNFSIITAYLGVTLMEP